MCGVHYALPPVVSAHQAYHTDTHPESSRAPARLEAVRDALAALPNNTTSLEQAANALHHELVRSQPPHHAPVYGEIHALFFGYIRRELRAGDAGRAAVALQTLARLAPDVPLSAKHRALALRLLGDPTAFAGAWRAVRRLMPHLLPKETTHAVRRLLRANYVGEACRIVQWHVRRFWRQGMPPPSFALLHNIMIQMRYVAAHIDTAPPPLQASYTEALVHLGTLLREHRLPLPGAREDVAWLIKLLYTYDARWAHGAHRAARVVGTSLPLYVRRLPAYTHAQTPALSTHTYNALVQYTLHYAHNPHWCRLVLEHMTHARNPPLAPSAALITILLRQATRWRFAALGTYALELHAPQPRTAGLLQHIEQAVADGDSHRLVALLHYITALHLKDVRASSVVRRIFPARGRRRPARVVLDANVGTAVLTLAAKAGKVALALRVWYWLKHECTDVPIPLAAATVLMRMLAEAARKPRAVLPPWAVRQIPRRPGAHEARVLALEEYAYLVRHWYATSGPPPDVHFFHPLLQLLRRTTHPHDAALVRILADMAALGIAPRQYPST